MDHFFAVSGFADGRVLGFWRTGEPALEMCIRDRDYIQGKFTVPVLKDISMEVEEGEYLAIMVPAGS